MEPQGGSTQVSEWAGLYDKSDRTKRTVARVVGMSAADALDGAMLADYMQLYLDWVEIRAAIGEDVLELLKTPVPDADRKLAAIRAHCIGKGRSWPSVERVLRIPFQEQVRMVTHGHPSMLWTWKNDPEKRHDFEELVRAGEPVRSLQRMFRLPERQVENLVKFFR